MRAHMNVMTVCLLAILSLQTEAHAASMLGMQCDQVLDKKFFQVCYDYELKGAKVVSYTLDGKLVNKKNLKKRMRFYPDREIPERYRSYPTDYTRNPLHMDRGHMASDASFDYSYKSQKATYVMSNVVPQFYLVNRKMWIKAEKYERLAAVKLGKVKVDNIIEYPENPKRIGKHQIAVPSGFWKVIHFNDHEAKCFYYRNGYVSKSRAAKDKLRDHLRPCSEIHGVVLK